MKKFYSFLLTLLFSFCVQQSFSQVIVFSFVGSNGDEASWPSSYEATGVQQSTITRGSGVTAAANADRFNSKNWTTGNSVVSNDYLEFTITPNSGYSVTLTDITLQHQRSSTGPKSFVIRTSLDNYASDATNVVTIPDVNTNQTSTFTFSSAIVSTTPVTIRIYAYNAETANGTWGPGESVDGNDIVVSGSLTILPVKFTNLKAVQKDQRITISFSNAEESDVQYYELQHSVNGRNFSDIAYILPSKNDGSQADYAYVHTASSTINFYRVKAVETTGHVLYSTIVRIQASTSSNAFSVYPNPVRQGSDLMLQLNNMKPGNYRISVFNSTSQLMQQQTISIAEASTTQTLSLNNYPKGRYVITIDGAVKLQKQFLVQ